jgi:hypothetical protein
LLFIIIEHNYIWGWAPPQSHPSSQSHPQRSKASSARCYCCCCRRYAGCISSGWHKCGQSRYIQTRIACAPMHWQTHHNLAPLFFALTQFGEHEDCAWGL